VPENPLLAKEYHFGATLTLIRMELVTTLKRKATEAIDRLTADRVSSDPWCSDYRGALEGVIWP